MNKQNAIPSGAPTRNPAGVAYCFPLKPLASIMKQKPKTKLMNRASGETLLYVAIIVQLLHYYGYLKLMKFSKFYRW